MRYTVLNWVEFSERYTLCRYGDFEELESLQGQSMELLRSWQLEAEQGRKKEGLDSETWLKGQVGQKEERGGMPL